MVAVDENCLLSACLAIPGDDEVVWLTRFHRGDVDVLGACYEEHFPTIERAIGTLLRGADRETVVQDVFLRLISEPELRRSFRGGSLGAWLATVGRRQAIDYWRRHKREEKGAARAAAAGEMQEGAQDAEAAVQEAEAAVLVERFRRERLPARWVPVFEARFIRQLSQRDAAMALGIRRTTLLYRELRIRSLLRSFLLRGSKP